MNVIARPAGKQPVRVEKRQVDARIYTVDCTPLLREHELMAAVLSLDAGPFLGAAYVRQGLQLELRLGDGKVADGAPFTDHLVRALVRTSQGRIEVQVEVRVYA